MCRRTRKNYTLAGFILLFFLFPSQLVSDITSQEKEQWDIQITADEIEYAREDERILADGNVKITYMDIVMTAEKMSYCRDKGLVEAAGDISFERDFFSVESSSMVYNIYTGTGHVHFARIISTEILEEGDVSTPPLVIEADSIQLRGNDEFFIPYGRITTCDEDTPHYYFSGSSLYVKLEDSFSIRKALFVVRGVPLFYYPYYRRELGPRRLLWHLDAGSSKIKGTFIRAGASYPLTENSRTGVGIEIMQKGGPGIYLDHGYSTGGGESDFEAYYLARQQSRQGRLRASGRQKISENITLRYRGRYSSERMIEHDYFGEESYGVNTLYYLGGAEYSGEGYTISVYGDRAEIWWEDSYEIYRMSLPGISGRVYSFDMGRRFIVEAAADYRRNYDTFYDRFSSELDWDSSLRRNFRINFGRRSYTSFSPGVRYDGRYREDAATNYLSLLAENRLELMRVLRTDTDYKYRAEYENFQEPEDNLLSYRITLRPYRPLSLTTRSSYDFTDNQEPAGDFISEARYRPGPVELHLRNRYRYYRRQSQWRGQLGLGTYSRTIVRYEDALPGVLDIDQQISFTLGPLDLKPAVRFKTENYYNFERFTEKRLDVLWNMHCWQSRLRLRRRGEQTEIWVLFNITVFPEESVGLYGNLAPDIMDFRYHKD